MLVDGADSSSEMTDFSYTDMTYVGNVNQNYGATITFNANATQDTTATLVVRLNRREIETVFTDLIGVTVNGEKIERDTIVPFIAKDSQWIGGSVHRNQPRLYTSQIRCKRDQVYRTDGKQRKRI